MNEYFLLYLFTRLGAIKEFFSILTAVTGFSVGVLYDALYFEQIDLKGLRRLSVPLFIFGCFGAILVPTKQDVAIILGGKMAIDVARSQEVSDVSKKILQAINKKLDEAGK